MKLYCYHKCSTCKKTQQFLEEQNYKFEIIEITDNTITYDQIKAMYEQSGQKINQLFNVTGNKYKELNLKERLPLMDVEQQLKLLITDGMLIKRPVLVDDETVIFGFNSKKWKLYERKKNG